MGSRRNLHNERFRARTGFSLIELLIALVLLEIGLLALVGMAAASTREANASRREASALSVASARLERAASLSCQGSNSGVSRAGPGVIDSYVEIVGPNGTRVISDSVLVVTTRGTRVTVLRIGARC
jgi:type II secretory pathway pseudopilin PulG